MLSYRHAFHAGNFADVHKHAVLALILEALQRKEAPFFVLDTHAGAGLYDLASPQAQKVREHEQGIARFWPLERNGPLPDLLRRVLASVNPLGRLARYPGSPEIIRQSLRDDDRAALVELHTTDFPRLKTLAAGDRRLIAHQRDGFESAVALIPPRERRGLVFIDPPYELKTDYRKVADTLMRAHRKWSTGVYAVWYPLLAGPWAMDLLQSLVRSGIRKMLVSELMVHPKFRSPGMNGSGMVIINPPWQLEEDMLRLMPQWLSRLEQEKAGSWRVEWLVPE